MLWIGEIRIGLGFPYPILFALRVAFITRTYVLSYPTPFPTPAKCIYLAVGGAAYITAASPRTSSYELWIFVERPDGGFARARQLFLPCLVA